MSLPAQVKRQLEEVAEIEKAITEQNSANSVEQTDLPTIALPEAVIAAVETKPEVVVEIPSNVVELKPAQDAEELTWKQRYKTLDGMIEAENRRNKDLHAQMQTIQAELAALKVLPKTETPKQKLVSDEEIESFGVDLIDVQRRIAREALEPLQAKLDALELENKALQGMLGQTGSQVATLSFEQRLQTRLPDFESINADPKWVAWLDEIDPLLRAPRRTVAQAAYERGDVDATAAYVDLFRKDTAAPTPVTVTAKETELRSQVAPSRSASSVVDPASSQMKTYTDAEAGKLFDKVGLLYRQGKNEEASKLEAELSHAYATGRVR